VLRQLDDEKCTPPVDTRIRRSTPHFAPKCLIFLCRSSNPRL
jgi:hypothetical protein